MGSRLDPGTTGIASVEISIDTGEELSRTETLPEMAETLGDFVFTVLEDPFPRVRILRRVGGGAN